MRTGRSRVDRSPGGSVGPESVRSSRAKSSGVESAPPDRINRVGRAHRPGSIAAGTLTDRIDRSRHAQSIQPGVRSAGLVGSASPVPAATTPASLRQPDPYGRDFPTDGRTGRKPRLAPDLAASFLLTQRKKLQVPPAGTEGCCHSQRTVSAIRLSSGVRADGGLRAAAGGQRAGHCARAHTNAGRSCAAMKVADGERPSQGRWFGGVERWTGWVGEKSDRLGAAFARAKRQSPRDWGPSTSPPRPPPIASRQLCRSATAPPTNTLANQQPTSSRPANRRGSQPLPRTPIRSQNTAQAGLSRHLSRLDKPA